jgi:predicted ATPase
MSDSSAAHAPARKIVLTGGPGAGKTVITHRLAEMHPERFVVVPEAATQVYSDLATRWDRLDLEGRRRVQRMIYAHQVGQEDRVARANPGKTLLLDRGTIDGAAYWPDGPAAYWADLGTTNDREIARYDHVIWLETAAALGIYDGDASNPVRFESPTAAVESGRLLQQLWKDHPHLHHVGAFVTLDDKIAAVMECL